MQNHEDPAQRMFDASVRVEKMFWVAGVCAQAPDDFEEFVEEDLADEADIIAEFPWLAAMLEDGAKAEDILCEFAFRKLDGLFVQLATPIPRDFIEDGKGYSFSWGYYRTKWFFCRSLDEIVGKAIPWQESVVAKAREKQAA